jgi:hypothetical protein
MIERITATWLVGDPSTDRAEIEAWAQAIAGAPVSAFIQIPPGRGQLAAGSGALVIGEPPEVADFLSPSWAVSSHVATFHERLVRTTGPAPDPSLATCLLLTRTFVPEAMQAGFRTWLDEEHSKLQLTVPGNHWYRGYEEVGGRRSLMNLWGIDAVEVAEGDVWRRTRSTQWRAQMVPAMTDMNRAFYIPVHTERD